jgi:hypothetical protein
MRSVRYLSVVVATMLALSVIAPSASAATHKAFHLTKTCESSIRCTLVMDDFEAIPSGTVVDYTFDASDPWDGLTFPTIVVRNGSTAGLCDWFNPRGEALARCTFASGTGRLTQFHLDVDVTVVGNPDSPDAVWHWDGWYWFGG